MISRSDARAYLPRGGASPGFTLIELVIVIAVVALAVTLVSTRGLPVGAATHARATAQAVSGALRAARGEAVATNRAVSFALDVTNRSYSWGRRAPERLPADIDLALLTGQDQLGAAGGQIRFYPDGSSSGGRVTIGGAGKVWSIGVDWISGRVSLVKTNG